MEACGGVHKDFVRAERNSRSGSSGVERFLGKEEVPGSNPGQSLTHRAPKKL